MGVQYNNENWELLFHRALLYSNMQQYADSTKDFTKALEFGPKGDANKFKVLLNFGINLRKQGELDKSKVYLKKAIDVQPKSAFAYNNLG